jgi:hypothetical protein
MKGIRGHGVSALMAICVVSSSFAAAQISDTAVCSGNPVTLPKGLEGWMDRTPLTASPSPPGGQSGAVAVGRGVDLALHPTADLHYARPPDKLEQPGEFGGMLRIEIADAGLYRVVLGSGAWIDLLAAAAVTPIASTAHARGPTCSDIRKMVDFPLKPGHYVLQISAGRARVIPVMIARLP